MTARASHFGEFRVVPAIADVANHDQFARKVFSLGVVSAKKLSCERIDSERKQNQTRQGGERTCGEGTARRGRRPDLVSAAFWRRYANSW
jgi:hypothetical protein